MDTPTRPSVSARMATGLAAAVVSLGVTQLAAAVVGPASDARNAVGTAVVNLTPGPVKEWAIQTFGTSDKTFLTINVLVVICVLAMVSAIWERSRRLGTCVLLAAGVAGVAAVITQTGARPFDVIPVIIGTAAGVVTLRLLNRDRSSATETQAAQPDPDRRRSLLTLGFLGLGAASGAGGLFLSRRLHSVTGERESLALPTVPQPAPAIPSEV